MKHLGKSLPNKTMVMAAEEAFQRSLAGVIQAYRPHVLFESGTYLGTGSTVELAQALRSNKIDGKIYTAEVNPEFYRKACVHLLDYPEVLPLHGLSVDRQRALEFLEVDPILSQHEKYTDIYIDDTEDPRQFYLNELRNAPRVEENLLRKVQQTYGPIELMLLDSAGGIGWYEFLYAIHQVKNECIIVLDDILHLKHWRSFEFIRNTPSQFEVLDYGLDGVGWLIARKFPNGSRRGASRPASISTHNANVTKSNLLDTYANGYVANILVNCLFGMGDVIQSTACIRQLKSRYPFAEITYQTHIHYADLATACPGVDRVIAQEGKLFIDETDFDFVRDSSFDLVIDLQPFRFHDAWELSDVHASSLMQGLCGFSLDLSKASQPWLEIPTDIQQRVRQEWVSGVLAKPSVGICISAKSADAWAEQNFIDVAQALLQAGFQVVQVGATQDNLIPGAKDLRGRNLLEVAENLARCDLYLGNDTGPTWLAVAMGTPTIALMDGKKKLMFPNEERRVGFAQVAPNHVLKEFLTDCSPQDLMDEINGYFDGAHTFSKQHNRSQIHQPLESAADVKFDRRIGGFELGHRSENTELVIGSAHHLALAGSGYISRRTRSSSFQQELWGTNPARFDRAPIFDLYVNAPKQESLKTLLKSYQSLDDKQLRYQVCQGLQNQLRLNSNYWDVRHAVCFLGRNYPLTNYLEIGATDALCLAPAYLAQPEASFLCVRGSSTSSEQVYSLSHYQEHQNIRLLESSSQPDIELLKDAVQNYGEVINLAVVREAFPEDQILEVLALVLPKVAQGGIALVEGINSSSTRIQLWKQLREAIQGASCYENFSGAGTGIIFAREPVLN